MKPLLIILGLLVSLYGYCQKHTEYTVGLVRKGAIIKNTDGQIIVTDSTVHTIIDGKTTTLKITSRDGFTLHVTDGTSTGKYVISHAKGRLHGFTYDSSITYHPAKKVSGVSLAIFMCSVKRDSVLVKP